MIKECTFVPTSEKFEHAIAMANSWMTRENITPLNVETINRLSGGDIRPFESRPVGVRIWYTAKE